MSAFFSQLVTSTISIYAALLGLWHEQVAVFDQAATAHFHTATVEQTTPDTEVNYVSLLDTLSRALEKIKTLTTSPATSTDQTTTATSTSETATSPADLGDAIVNIYCTQKTDQYKRNISGTGFFISDTGVILTNAHVGQFLLLEQTSEFGEIDCYVRIGVTAIIGTYEVALLYLSPTWLLSNQDTLATVKPRGTGENDFALLYVTGALNDNELPTRFPYLPAATSPLTRDYQDKAVILVGYPAEEKITGDRVVATTTITKLYTFDSGYADIFSLAPSALGHQGSSGGPVIDNLGRAIGVMTTKDLNTTILNAITLAHIDRQIREETGFDLTTIVKSDLSRRAEVFNATLFPILQSILVDKLE